MKTDTRVRNVVSTLEGEDIGMTIDEHSLAHIMSVLTDLYSDPELAIIREYSTNAYDAHVEAGVTRPIEVTTPTPLAPFFRVRDYGDGLNVDDIREVYSRYGTSTKRNSNEVVGMLGLGCKSALTYSDQFTVTAVKDGVCTQVSVERTEDGSGRMKIVSEYETSDPSGVEVIIPARGNNRIAEKAHFFFSFWEEGTVLVDGHAPKRITGTWIADDLLMSEQVDRDMIVMGNVAYPASNDPYQHGSALHDGHPIVAFVEIGDVNFTPSREALQMTKKTKDALDVIRVRVEKEKQAAFEKQLQAASTQIEALKVYTTIKRLGYKNDKPKFNGVDIPESYKCDKDDLPFSLVGYDKYWGMPGWTDERVLVTSTWVDAPWVVGLDKPMTPHKRKQLLQWAAKNKIELMVESSDRYAGKKKFVVCKEVPAEIVPWIDSKNVHQWSEVALEKIERKNQKRPNGTPSGSYETLLPGPRPYVQHVQAEDIDTTHPIFFCTKSQDAHFSVIQEQNPGGFTIVSLGLNRVEKFKRDFPNAVNVGDHLRGQATTWLKGLAPDDLKYLQMSQAHMRAELQMYDPERIDDPDLKLAVTLARSNRTKLLKAFEWYNRFVILPHAGLVDPRVNYPLLTNMRNYGRMNDKFKDHLYTYINAAFAVEQES